MRSGLPKIQGTIPDTVGDKFYTPELIKSIRAFIVQKSPNGAFLYIGSVLQIYRSDFFGITYLLPLSYGIPSALGALDFFDVKARTMRVTR